MRTLQVKQPHWFATTLCFCCLSMQNLAFGQGAVEMEFADMENGAPVSARITFTKSLKRLARPKKILFAGEQWLAEQKMPLTPPVGEYEFMVLRGPEFKEIRGGFTIEPKAKDSVRVEIPRAINMHEEHWYSGDHLSRLPMNQLSRWQVADAVDMVVSVDPGPPDTPAPPKRRGKETKPTNDEPEINEADTFGLRLNSTSQLLDWQDGCMILHHPHDAASIDKKQKDAPESTEKGKAVLSARDAWAMIEEAKSKDGFVGELLKPWARDVPILIGMDAVRAVQVLSSYHRPAGDDRIVLSAPRDKIMQGKIAIAKGKERGASTLFAPISSQDELRYKGPRGIGLLNETIYWNMLEAGLRVTPTAGSDFSNNDTQVGYNRVYAYSETVPTVESWWRTIELGRTVVTNGPLLRVTINGQTPGSTQASYRGQSITLDIAASLAVRESVDYLDVISNGETVYSAKLEDHYNRGEFPSIEIKESGWVVVRVITAFDKGYRLATTAPFYFEFDGKPRVSRKAVRFFQDWLELAKKDIAENEQTEQYQTAIEQAEQFWQSKFERSQP